MKGLHGSVAVLAVLALAACGDATGPGNASDADRQEILAILDETSWFDDRFGDDGAVANASVASGFDFGFAAAAPQDTVSLVRLWGRRHGLPVTRERNVSVTRDTATVTINVVFEGQFLLDRTADGVVNPTNKPLDVTLTQTATLVRRAEADSAGRRWQLIGLTPRQSVNTDPAKRTVSIERVVVTKNGDVIGDFTSAGADIRLDGGLMNLAVGDEIGVTATVANTTGIDNVPPTFVFLHLFHAAPNGRLWLRLPMTDNGDGTWTRTWTVRFNGRERIMVDAIDSQAFNTDAEDDYRGNVWGVPYRIR